MLRPVLILLLALVEQNSCFVFPIDPNEDGSCTLADGTIGMCRLDKDCDYLRSIPQKHWKRCSSFVGHNSMVCCRRSGYISERMCDGFPSFPEASNHIYGGETADLTDFPYLGALAYVDGSDVAFRCGASLISREYALTAAHCVTREEPVFIRLGVVTIFGDDNTNDEPVDVGIKDIIMHPNYKSPRNDIALLKLNRTVDEEFLMPACLYTNLTDPSLDAVLSIAGWGANVSEPGEYPMQPDLMKATVTTIDREECDRMIKAATGFKKQIRQLTDGQVCALGRNATGATTGDTCVGDSGGPLELAIGKRKYIVGITSTGTACGSEYPGIYTRVSRYIDWIEKIVWPA